MKNMCRSADPVVVLRLCLCVGASIKCVIGGYVCMSRQPPVLTIAAAGMDDIYASCRTEFQLRARIKAAGGCVATIRRKRRW